MKKTNCILILLLALSNLYAQNFRYVNTIFHKSIKIQDVIYSNALFLDFPYNDESSVRYKDLVMDIYLPAGDTLTFRPAIVFAHGGGFISGKRTADDMVAFCDGFTKKGYVTATIDYREGVEVLNNPDLHYTRSAYWAIQDGHAAIRYLRAHAETYGIAPDKIYWGGNCV